MAAYFVIETLPIKQRHLCWRTTRNAEKISLIEVVESHYRHPDAPEHAIVPVVEELFRYSLPVTDHRAAPLLLLEASHKNISLQFVETNTNRGDR